MPADAHAPAARAGVAIVGAGIAGLSLAYALADAMPVVVLEAGVVGAQGASSLPAALLNPYRGRTARAHDGDVAGLDAFWRRDARLRADGHDTGAHRSGVLRVASSAGQAELWARTAAGDSRVRLLGAREVGPAYHAPHGALLVPGGGWVQPERLLRALAGAVRAAGGAVVEHARVTGCVRDGGAWTLACGDRQVRAERLVLCPGAEPAPGGLAPAAGLARLAGDVIGLDAPQPFDVPVAGAVYGVHAQGTAWVGGNHRDADAADPGAPDALRRSIGWFVPSLRAAPVASVWTGVRLKRRGNRPLVRCVAEDAWFFGALAGRGFLCSAAEAERLALRLTA